VLRIESISSIETAKQVAWLLQKENERLHQRLNELLRENARLKGQDGNAQLELELKRIEQQMSKLQRMMFSASSERRKGDGENQGEPEKENEEKKVRGHGPHEQPSLPRIDEVIAVPEEERTCELCGGQLEEWVGQFEEAEEITVVERQFVIKKIKRQKCRCPQGCTVKTAPSNPKPIEGGRYSTEFAVEVAIAKYLDHLPLERQVRIMGREGLEITSQTLWDQLWALKQLYEPSGKKILQHIISQEVAYGDETPWFLLPEGGRKKWYAWAAACHDAVYFRIDPHRSTEAAEELWQGFSGTMMVDGYNAYVSLAKKRALGDLKLAYCWAHVRRKFVECEKDYPLECKQALDLIRAMYKVESECPNPWKGNGAEREALFEHIAKMRHEKTRPIAEELKKWGQQQLAFPESTFREAIEYMLGHWTELTRFLDNPKIPIDNNKTERTIRGPVLGRKNHYGSKSRRGAETTALMYTLIETAKLQGVNPKTYLLAVAKAALKNPSIALLPNEI